MHHRTDRIIHTTVFNKAVVEHWLEREIAQWVHPMKDRSDDPSLHERMVLPQSYISLPNKWCPSMLIWFDVFNTWKLQGLMLTVNESPDLRQYYLTDYFMAVHFYELHKINK